MCIDTYGKLIDDARVSSTFHCQSQVGQTKECPTRGLQDGDTTLMLRWKGGANWGPATVSFEGEMQTCQCELGTELV